jgi:membrane protein implicated in regulation of membrane protease activity
VAAHWIWLILAGMLVGAELLTGTFYLLAVGIAFAVGGVAAWLGAGLELQLFVAGALAIAGTFAAHRWRRTRGSAPADLAIDIGQPVRVQAWNPDGTARVAYRGSLWAAEPASADVVRGETLYIVAMRGSTLIVSDRKPRTVVD